MDFCELRPQILLAHYVDNRAVWQVVFNQVDGAIAELTAANGGTKPSPREMGGVMKAAQAKIAASGLRADGKQVSELVKAELAK
jgi:uncharacterized protein YqeY